MCVAACAHSTGARGPARTMTRPRPLPVLHLLTLTASALLVTSEASLNLDFNNTLTSARQLHLFGWYLELEENEAMQSPDYKECNFYKGRVLHEPESTAMVTECDDNWYGLLQVGDEIYVLPPKQQSTTGEHVLHRRDVLLALMAEKVPVYNLTNDIEGNYEPAPEEIEDAEFATQKSGLKRIHTRSSQATHEDFFRRDVPTISAGSRLWLELAIVADHTMVKFHGDKVQHYILALMNVVSAIFNDRSLGANMTLVINKLFLLEKQDPVVQDGGPITETLKRVNKWNKRHRLKIPTESARWDALVWLTRSYLSGASGLARMKSICTLNSATVQRDEGFTSAFVIAHELGHLLGLDHDDDQSGCQAKRHASTIMAPIVRGSLDFSWSNCSRTQFHSQSRKWKCLQQRSGATGVELETTVSQGNLFTMEYQCRAGYGEGYTVCKVKMDTPLCTNLYCAHQDKPSVCYSKNEPPQEGTPCKKHHSCTRGKCLPTAGHRKWEQPPTPRSQWDAWRTGACDAACGYGLRVNQRRCRHQEGSKGNCHGSSTRFETCWSGKSCAQTRDERAELCQRIVSEFIPYIHDDPSKHCQLWCVNHMGGDPSVFGSLPDGTACSYHRPYDICYRGVCLQGYCNASDLGCNWCSNDQCHNYTNSSVRKLQNGWTSLIDIPQEARRFSIHIETHGTPLELAIRVKNTQDIFRLSNHSKRHKIYLQQEPTDYLKYDVNVPQNLRIIELGNKVRDFSDGEAFSLEGKLATAGTVINWKQTEMDVFLTSESQPTSSLTILVATETQNSEEVKLSLNFSFPYSNAAARPPADRRRDRFGPCSTSCGGGIRLVMHRCQAGHPCIPVTYEACNLHRCEFKWHPGDWEECSHTCGEEGLQERQMFCVPVGLRLSSLREVVRLSVSPALCKSSPPPKQQPCNQLPCPAYWQEMPWTQCSRTCGPGEKIRPLVCPAANEAFCGTKPRERRQKCHHRQRCPHTTNYRRQSRWPNYNTIQSCDLFMPDERRSYCKIPFFRKHCITTCRKVDT